MEPADSEYLPSRGMDSISSGLLLIYYFLGRDVSFAEGSSRWLDTSDLDSLLGSFQTPLTISIAKNLFRADLAKGFSFIGARSTILSASPPSHYGARGIRGALYQG